MSVDTRAVTSTPPTGFFLLGQEFDIEAPDAPDADHPMRFVFELDATVPAGSVTVFRNGWRSPTARALRPQSRIRASRA